MCKWGTDKLIYVIRRNNEYISDGWHEIGVDACIADYVQRMNEQGIITVGCCCGHFKGDPLVLVDPTSIDLLVHYGYAFEIKDYDYQYLDGTPYIEKVVEHFIDRADLASFEITP